MLAQSPSQRLMIKCLTIPDRIGIWKCWFLRRGENRSTRRKTSRSKEENQQQTQPTYDAGSGNQTRDTLVGGERSHHCAIPAPGPCSHGPGFESRSDHCLDLFCLLVNSMQLVCLWVLGIINNVMFTLNYLFQLFARPHKHLCY